MKTYLITREKTYLVNGKHAGDAQYQLLELDPDDLSYCTRCSEVELGYTAVDERTIDLREKQLPPAMVRFENLAFCDNRAFVRIRNTDYVVVRHTGDRYTISGDIKCPMTWMTQSGIDSFLVDIQRS